jgi:hypothetical protein
MAPRGFDLLPQTVDFLLGLLEPLPVLGSSEHS